MRTQPENLEPAVLTPAAVTPALLHLVNHAHNVLERAWDEDTAYQGIELADDDPVSRGQCGVSSLWFARYLANLGIAAQYVEGSIRYADFDDPVEMVWVEVRAGGKVKRVDLTNNQYPSLYRSGWSIDDVTHDGTTVSYLESERHSPDNIPHRRLLGRYAILEARVNDLPFWRTWHLPGVLPGGRRRLTARRLADCPGFAG
jgi:hypothetical protein